MHPCTLGRKLQRSDFHKWLYEQFLITIPQQDFNEQELRRGNQIPPFFRTSNFLSARCTPTETTHLRHAGDVSRSIPVSPICSVVPCWIPHDKIIALNASCTHDLRLPWPRDTSSESLERSSELRQRHAHQSHGLHGRLDAQRVARTRCRAFDHGQQGD